MFVSLVNNNHPHWWLCNVCDYKNEYIIIHVGDPRHYCFNILGMSFISRANRDETIKLICIEGFHSYYKGNQPLATRIIGLIKCINI